MASSILASVTPDAPHENGLESDDGTAALVEQFLGESHDALSVADQALLDIERRSGASTEDISQLLGVFHTIKGVAAALEFEQATCLAHAVEGLLEVACRGRVSLEGRVLELMFDATQTLRAVLAEVRRAAERGEVAQRVRGVSVLIERIQTVVERDAGGRERVLAVPPGSRLGEILVQVFPSVSPEGVEQALAAQRNSGRHLGEELVALGVASEQQVASALVAQACANAPVSLAPGSKGTVRIELDQLDALVRLVAELGRQIDSRSTAPMTSEPGAPSGEAEAALRSVRPVVRDLRALVHRLRCVPIDDIFRRMIRLVRDVARRSNKSLQLVREGDPVDVDRHLVEPLADALVHLVRNAVDHGIETSEERRRRGKPVVGTIRLCARRDNGWVLVEVSDDGQGLAEQDIARRARERGLLADGDEAVCPERLQEIVFEAGFTTASDVTELSGRGVGLDAVRRYVRGAGGSVEMSTRAGHGVTFLLRLPCRDDPEAVRPAGAAVSLEPSTPGLRAGVAGLDRGLAVVDAEAMRTLAAGAGTR
jgi:two-component system chemotaxis sensor kinase CheA